MQMQYLRLAFEDEREGEVSNQACRQHAGDQEREISFSCNSAVQYERVEFQSSAIGQTSEVSR